jgi:uncharacterized DUF497 family protein
VAEAIVGGMDLEWDAAKDAENRRKHGLPLAAAARLDWDAGAIEPDLRRDYGEPRWTLTATLDGRMHVCVFTLRNGRRRIISLGKANLRERRKHGNRTPPTFD